MTDHPISSAVGQDEALRVSHREALDAWRELITALGDEELQARFQRAGRAVVDALASGNKILVAGNGGSAAIASHVAAEFIGKCVKDRAPLPAVNLAESISSLTAVGNDYGFDDIFVRGVRALGRPGDVLIAMSTSGRSRNIAAAIEAARDLGVVTIALSGREPNLMAAADHVLCVPSTSTPRIQEVHMVWTHGWCEAIDELSQR